MIKVSVIIPAYNAAETISDTLRSLLAQTFTEWEALVVNDGSTDHTVEVVQTFIEQDSRIRLVSQENQGLSGARNTGVALAKYDWLLFLDADDWTFPQHLKQLSSAIECDPSLDIVYCGWAYVLPDGEFVFPQLPTLTGDLFLPFTQYCVSIVHTFLVPRSLVIRLGPFDTVLRSCEDWSLWQRIARTGVRFGAVTEILAAYRTRPDSLSRNGDQLLRDGFQVLMQGHGPDARAQPAHPLHSNGLPLENLTKNKFDLLCACAGYLIGGGKDARPLLKQLQADTCSTLKPLEVAQCMLVHTLVSASRPRIEWPDVWTNCQANFFDFLKALETYSKSRNLANPSYALAQKLLSEYLQRPALLANATSDQFAQQAANFSFSFSYTLKQMIKNSLRTAFLMSPTVRKPIHWLKKSLASKGYFQSAAHPSSHPKQYFEQLFTEHPDPWSYTNRYEQIKYEQTLALIPNVPIKKALELACAEGHFTVQLSPRVEQLLATDISPTALVRCEQACSDVDNVEFRCLDFLTEPITEKFDLIVCSEVLYFAGDRAQLPPMAAKLAQALNPDGYLVMTHSNVLIDDPSGTGFDWDHAFGARFIGATFANSPQLAFLQELQTPLYRIQLFQQRSKRFSLMNAKPKTVERIERIEPHHLPSRIAQSLVLTRSKPLPILSYRSLSLKPAAETEVTPEIFEQQLRYLQGAGYRSMTIQDWGYSVISNAPVTHKSFAVAFSHAHSSFLSCAWPLLKKYGFSATVVLYAGEIGALSVVDPYEFESIPLIAWPQIRQLQAEGVTFASGGLTRQTLSGRSRLEIWQSLKQSRDILTAELGAPVSTFVYPDGRFDPLLQLLVGLAGYSFALCVQSGICSQKNSLLALPQLSINATTDIETLLPE